MGGFAELERFEARFERWSEAELLEWRRYWLAHAGTLRSDARKSAMKRIHRIDRRIRDIRSDA